MNVLENLDINKIEQEIYRLDSEIRKVKALEERREVVDNILKVLHEYLLARNNANSALGTPQDKDTYDWMSKYPWLAIQKRWAGCMNYISGHQAEKWRNLESEEDMKKLEESGYIKRTEALLSRFYKDKESTKAKPIEASAKRPIGAEVSEV